MNPPLEQVMEQYANSVYAAAYSLLKNKHDAEDVTQETFLKYYVRKRDFASPTHLRVASASGDQPREGYSSLRKQTEMRPAGGRSAGLRISAAGKRGAVRGGACPAGAVSDGNPSALL